MSITVNLYYTGVNGNARRYAEEMERSGTADAIRREHTVDWKQMLNLIHLTGMEKSLKNQYQNATNISARINLHRLYSVNTKGWFPFLYDYCEIQEEMQVLEIGCGNGAFWTENKELSL